MLEPRFVSTLPLGEPLLGVSGASSTVFRRITLPILPSPFPIPESSCPDDRFLLSGIPDPELSEGNNGGRPSLPFPTLLCFHPQSFEGVCLWLIGCLVDISFVGVIVPDDWDSETVEAQPGLSPRVWRSLLVPDR